MPAPIPFALDCAQPGVIDLTLNGQTVAADGVTFGAERGQIPTLIVQLPHGGKLEGIGFVEVAQHNAADAVRALDPEAVREAVANSNARLDQDPAVVWLEAIAGLLDAP